MQIDSKTIEAYYREKFVPQLKQSDRGGSSSADVAAKIRELLTQEKVNELMVSWLQSLRSESKVSVPGLGGCRGRSADPVTEPAARPPRWWKYLLLTVAVGVIALLAGLWYSTTNSFQAYVRRRMVAEVERITGGRAEIGSFHVVPFHLQVEVRNITVHGKESPTDVPLAHADSLVAQLKVISFLRTEFGFYSVTLEHPVIHIAIGPDGTTNVPAPQLPGEAFGAHSDRAAVRAVH